LHIQNPTIRSVPKDGFHDVNIALIECLESSIAASIHWQLQFPCHKATIESTVGVYFLFVCVERQMESNVWYQIAFVKYETLHWHVWCWACIQGMEYCQVWIWGSVLLKWIISLWESKVMKLL
jgi:hypothetical protein